MVAYEPGTVAEIGWAMTSGKELALFDGRFWNTESGISVVGPTSVRPLVVLDLGEVERRAQVSNIIERLRVLADTGTTANAACTAVVVAAIADQIEAQTKPPRIPEPGLWGVVADADGYYWTSSLKGLWSRLNDGFRTTWDDIKAPVLVREGVS